MVDPLSSMTQLIAVQGPEPLVGSKGEALAGFGAEPRGFSPLPACRDMAISRVPR